MLALHLKRWPPDDPNGLITTVVTPPRTLTFANLTYHLRSIILHRGATADGGHYVALMHQPVNNRGEWWLYDDSQRKAATPADLATAASWTSYVCFYEQTL